MFFHRDKITKQKEQRGIQMKGYSLNNQRSKIKDYCKYMDYDLVEVYEDREISGMGIDKRNGYKDMLEYLMKNDIEGL